MRTFAETSKGKEKKGGKSKKKKKPESKTEDDLVQESQEEEEKDAVTLARERLRAGRSNTTRVKPLPSTQQEESSDEDDRKGAASIFSIRDKVTAKDLQNIDKSVVKGERDIEEEKAKYLGGDEDRFEGFYDDDEEVDFSKLRKKEDKMASLDMDEGGRRGIFGRITSAFQNFTGNKELTEQDIRPVLKSLSDGMVNKNVAKVVADEISMSIMKQLIGQRTQSFTSVDQTVQAALMHSLEKILTPKRHIDVLKEALSAKQKGQVYSIVFIGVNGVGKSTSLSKMAYYLKNKGGLKVMLAGCDNFRSGAIEQLKTHARVLDVPLYEKGYKDDPATIAKEALVDAKNKHYDVVLIDTAGRMQGNESLMRQLAKLVHINKPNVVLFVGEALVGNDAIDQLTKFNQSLIDFAYNEDEPRTIDGIILTKFDTVDDKVGTALNMVHSTGKPIVFVGVGQKYPHFRRLNVQTVAGALLS